MSRAMHSIPKSAAAGPSRFLGATAFALILLGVSMRLAGAQSACPGGSGTPIAITNFKTNETVGYDLLLVKGTVGAGTQQVSLSAGGASTTWPVAGTLFRGFVRIKPGANKVVVSAAGNQNACFDVTYAPNLFAGQIRLVILVPGDVSLFHPVDNWPSQERTDTISLKKRIGLAALMQQSLIADLLGKAGKPHLAPYIVRDAQGDPEVKVVRLERSKTDLEANDYRELANIVGTMNSVLDGRTHSYCFYPTLSHIFGLDGSVVSGMTDMYNWPQDVSEITARYTDRRTLKEIGVPGHDGDTDPFNTVAKNGWLAFGFWFKVTGLFGLGVPNVDALDQEAFGGWSNRLFTLFMTKTDLGSDIIDELPSLSTGTSTYLSNTMWIPDPQPPRTPALPASAIPAGLVQGLTFKYYVGTFDKLPDFSLLTPTTSGNTPDFTLQTRAGEENFALLYDGYIKVDAAGPCLFTLGSDDGSRLILDGKTLIDNDSTHAERRRATPTALEAGFHRIQVQYFKKDQTRNPGAKRILTVRWANASIPALQPISVTALSRTPGVVGLRSVNMGLAGAALRRTGGHATLSLGFSQEVTLTLVSPSGRFQEEVFHGILPAGVHGFPMPRGSESSLLVLGKDGHGTLR